MTYFNQVNKPSDLPLSALELSEHLLSLAQDAERAGYQIVAEHLTYLAAEVLDPEISPEA